MNEIIEYKDGDKVILLNLPYLNKHFLNEEQIIKEYSITSKITNRSNYFYICYPNGKINETPICRKTGLSTDISPKKYYHKEKERFLILSEINKELLKYDTFCKDNDLKRKDFLQKTILECQEEIKEIERGNGSFKHGFETYKNKEFKEKFLSIIKNNFDFKINETTSLVE